MPNLAATIRLEITRLARRECRSQIKALRKASAQFRRDIAQLKRRSAALQSEVGRLKRLIGKATPAQAAEVDSPSVRFTPKGVSSQRRRLGLSAADYGKLVGVTGHTVYKWEHGASRPRRAQLASLAAIRGLGRKEARARLEPRRKRSPRKGRSKR